MFFGNFDHALDPKNRLIIPARYRDVLVAQGKPLEFFLTPGLDACLFLFARDQFQKICDSFEERSFAREAARKFQRIFFGDASPCTADGMGRILIPDYLKSHAGIEKDVKIVGVSNRVEIWDRSRWERYREDNRGEYEALANEIVR